MNNNGFNRPATARVGFYSYQRQTTNGDTKGVEIGGQTVTAVAVSGPDAVTIYNDMYDGASVVTGGTVKTFADGIGVLTADTAEDGNGTYAKQWQGWLPILSSDTPADGDKLYWDATNYRLTTTASGNTLAGVARNIDGVIKQTVSTAILGSLPVGTWVHIMVYPS